MGQVWIAGQVDTTLTRVGLLLLDRGHLVQRLTEASAAPAEPPDLLLARGAEVAQSLRALAPAAPLVIYVPEGQPAPRGAAALVLRAPIDPEELLLRCLSLLDPGAGAPGRGVVIDARRRRVLVDGLAVHFTDTEFRLLEALAERAGEAFTRRQLLRQLTGTAVSATERTIDAHVRSIRKKLGSRRGVVETVRGVGYRFVDHGPGASPEPTQRHGLVASAIPGGVFLLEPGQAYDVGRVRTCAVVLPHASVSRVHVRLEWREERFWIADQSSYGTRLNGHPLQGERALDDRDEVGIGPFTLRYRAFSDVQRVLDELSLDEERSTPRIATGAGPRPRERAGLTSFSGGSLVQVCQLISVQRQSGTIEVRGPLASGSLSFYAGFIVDAHAQGYPDSDAAARALLRQRSGAYRLVEQTGSGSFDAITETARFNVFETLAATTQLLQELDAYHRAQRGATPAEGNLISSQPREDS